MCSSDLMALTAAYLAGETLFLSAGGAKRAIVPLLGLVHGLPFAPFPGLYWAGAAITQIGLLAILSLAVGRLPAAWRKPALALCLTAALGWFTRFVVR